MRELTLQINGHMRTGNVEHQTLLVEHLRESLCLTGTHVGCDTSQCGACVVRLDGETVKSCTVLATTLADGARVETIEGVAQGATLHPMQKAFSECHALQCGFCTPGLVITAIDIVEKHKGGVSREIIRKELKGNICRCTGYLNIVAAIMQGAMAMGATVTPEMGGA